MDLMNLWLPRWRLKSRLVERKTLAAYGGQHWSRGAFSRQRGIEILSPGRAG